MERMRSVVPVALLLLVEGCTSASPAESPAELADGDASVPDAMPRDAAKGDAAVAPTHAPSPALRACAEKSGDVRSIADAVARFNALGASADASCLLATLPRPLRVVATTGMTSAQPAGGKDSPRLFFMLEGLVVSTVPAGDGSRAVEFGQWVSSTRTLKGEIAVPAKVPLALGAAFEGIARGDRSVCGTCHRDEQPSSLVANGFVSLAFKPEPGTFVTVTELSKLHDACVQSADTSPRCAMFHAVFDFGDVVPGAFANEVETFMPR